ncbi:MAG: hypothetical protein WCG80_14140 [Spirochaetales bacterium]
MARFAVSAWVLALVFSSCAPAPLPPPSGTLLFHRYSNYDAWDSHLWLAELPTAEFPRGRLAVLGSDWPVEGAMNGQISPDGTALVFMGDANGPNAQGAERDWDVFVSNWDGEKWLTPRNLTARTGSRDEDPKWAPDSQSIVYKRGGGIETMDRDGNPLAVLSPRVPEAGMPYFSTDGEAVVYAIGSGTTGAILITRDGKVTLGADLPGSDYYPITVDANSFYFTNVQPTQHDRLMVGFWDGREPQPLFFDSEYADNSDAGPALPGHSLYYVSTQTGGHGGYDLRYADLDARTTVSFDELVPGANTTLEELGPSWTPLPRFAQTPTNER